MGSPGCEESWKVSKLKPEFIFRINLVVFFITRLSLSRWAVLCQGSCDAGSEIISGKCVCFDFVVVIINYLCVLVGGSSSWRGQRIWSSGPPPPSKTGFSALFHVKIYQLFSSLHTPHPQDRVSLCSLGLPRASCLDQNGLRFIDPLPLLFSAGLIMYTTTPGPFSNFNIPLFLIIL